VDKVKNITRWFVIMESLRKVKEFAIKTLKISLKYIKIKIG
jgi:hypothetical protein